MTKFSLRRWIEGILRPRSAIPPDPAAQGALPQPVCASGLDLLRMPRQGQMAQEFSAARVAEPHWWDIAPPQPFAVAGVNRCAWCFNIFDRERRPLAEVEALRRVLMIEMTTPFDPPICNECFAAVTGSAVPADQVSGKTPPMTPFGLSNLALHEWRLRATAE